MYFFNKAQSSIFNSLCLGVGYIFMILKSEEDAQHVEMWIKI